ncbi:MAG: Cof-type HAD-IIB family hydrolase [Armatimonadetes bacterium]|nr:Cof-type HAD-IIB family hydrolase [Armatimonadota bacterium]
MKHPYRLAAVDLDDTLLGPDHRISPRNAAAVRTLLDAGVEVVIASGRMHASTTAFAEELGLNGPILSYNGAMVKVPASGEIYHHVPVPADLASEIVAFAEERDLPLNYYLDDQLRVKRHTDWSDLYHRRTGSVIHAVGNLRQYDGEQPTKMIILGAEDRVRALAQEMKERYAGRLTVLISHPEYLEFMAPNVSKAYGLEAIGQRHGIAAEEMIAFGDSGNDIAMLEYAGFGVAMGNAREEVKAVSDYVAPRHDEDGFALAVESCIDLVKEEKRES